MSPKTIRIVIIDDSAFIRRALSRIFGSDPRFNVVGEASDGNEGVEKIKELSPDLVTLDVRMPEMDGLATLSKIMKEKPTPVLMLSSYTQEGAEVTLRSLELGAIDFIDKSSAGSMMDFIALRQKVLEKAVAVSQVDIHKVESVKRPAPVFVSRRVEKKSEATTCAAGEISDPDKLKLVVIGSSTGGPPALQRLVAKIPIDIAATFLIVQHMPVGFTASLAERLNRSSDWKISELQNEESMCAGHMYVAPSGWHATIKLTDSCFMGMLDTEPLDSLHRPSIDISMTSAGKAAGSRAIGVVLTGMGRDGAEGARVINRAGGKVIAESEETAIIFGMPRAVIEAGAADIILPIDKIPAGLTKLIRA